MSIEGKKIIITGGATGYGYGDARALKAAGGEVWIVGRRLERLRKAAEELGVRFIQGDITRGEDWDRIMETVGEVDILVNNAGIAHIGLLQDMTDEEWDRILSVNLSSVFYTSRAAIPLFLKNRRAGEGVPGRILNISSVWGNVGASCEAAYSATKGGVNSLTRALAKELAPSGIPVNAIACGCVDTRMNAQLSAEEKAELSEEIPAGRFAQTSEIARAVLSLIHAPAYLTGQIVTVDGGWI